MSKRIAICIGVNKHKNAPKANLKFARHDAQAIVDLLQDPMRGCFDTVFELYDNEASKDNIIIKLKDVLLNSNLSKEDTVLIYFSGHGYTDQGDNLCLVPYDVKFIDEETVDIYSTVHITEFQMAVDNTKAGSVIFVLDACYAGGASKLIRNVKYKDNSNLIVIGAARSSQKAWETEELAHSNFTKCLLQSSNLQPIIGEWITFQQAIGFTQTEMKKIEDRQTMEVAGHTIDQNILFTKNPMHRLDSDRFTDHVRDLCTLLQLEIIQTQPSQSFPNTLVVREPRSFDGQTDTLIICLDNTKVNVLQNDIAQLNQLFDQLQSSNQVDRGVIITRKELPTSLKTKIASAMTAKTVDDIRQTLLDFRRYREKLIDDFRKTDQERYGEPPLEKCFIELDIEVWVANSAKPIHVPLTTVINDWLTTENEPVAMILGGFGTGKTTAARKIAYDLAKAYHSSSDKQWLRTPIVFSLRKFPTFSTVNIEDFIVAHLKHTCKVNNPDFEAFEAMNRDGLLLLIFDGFDEMAIRANKDIIQRNFREIIQFATEVKAKVLITSRPEAFLSEREANRIYYDFHRATGNSFRIKKFNLCPFSESQIELYLKKRIPFIGVEKDWKFYRNQIDKMVGLKHLVERPVLLEITVKVLPQLLREGGLITQARIYETYLSDEITRQNVNKKRELLIKKEQRVRLMEIVACHLVASDKGNWSLIAEEMENLLRPEAYNLDIDLEPFVRDFINCSFMIRERNQYLFSHRSFMEFLIARAFSHEIEAKNYFYFNKIALSKEILSFLVDLKPADDSEWRKILWEWVWEFKFDPESDLPTVNTSFVNGISQPKNLPSLGGNSLSVLSKIGESLDNINLNNTILSSLHLDKTSISGASFAKSLFSNAYFDESTLSDINFEGAVITNAHFNYTSMERVNFKDAQITNAHFDHAEMRQAIFEGVEITNAHFDHAEMRQAIFKGVEITNAHFDHAEMRQAIFEGVQITNAHFDNAKMPHVTFKDVKISEMHFDSSILHDASFEDVTITQKGTFTQTDLSRANLLNIRWENTVFDETILTGTQLENTTFNSKYLPNDYQDENLPPTLSNEPND